MAAVCTPVAWLINIWRQSGLGRGFVDFYGLALFLTACFALQLSALHYFFLALSPILLLSGLAMMVVALLSIFLVYGSTGHLQQGKTDK